ncbi:MAG: hypothetical protein JWM74_5670 [Myxococcaceae bacterium]|nr:hypothetical protein [Myxococcaceae bacterium]
MQDPKKPDHSPDLGAELDDIDARLLASRKKLSAAKPPTTGKPIERQVEPSSQTGVPRLSIAEIDSKLVEVREARRARQSTPNPDKPPADPPKKK